ncbi:unnamed protein product [Calypogeia fissa]
MASIAVQSLRRKTFQWVMLCPLRNAPTLQTQINGKGRTAQREFSNQAGPPGFGIAFDIDGVLLRGGKPIGGAPRALQQLYENPPGSAQLRVPYVFLTNGGGVTEATKAIELSHQLGVPVSPDQVLLGHSPFKQLVGRFGHKRILAVGKGEPDVVMKSYGFQQVVHMDSYVNEFANIDPLARYKPWLQPPSAEDDMNIPRNDSEEVAAVFVVSDPVDWGRDLQVICDVLRSGGHPTRGTRGIQTPIYLASDDLVYQSLFPVPRFGMGAFRIALESLYNKLPVDPLIYTTFGKPQTDVYRHAEQVLQQLQESMVHTPHALAKELMHGLSFPPPANIDPPKLAPLKTIYMIGDNPATDIKGAKLAGESWFSILTRTGVFQDNSEISADKVVEDVKEAIDFIGEREGLQIS